MNTGMAAEDLAQSGLSTEQVAERHAQGQSNHVKKTTSRPISEILRANIFTIFNGVLTVAVIAILAVGDWRDAVFGLVMVLNSAIGVFSELRSKKTLDSVAVLEAPTSMVFRDGALEEIPSDDLVCDDLISLKLGDQIPADGEVRTCSGLEVDESILTGESLPVHKQPGDRILSGTAVVAGSGTMIAQQIGYDAWAQKITSEAKQFSLATSEIQQSINKILRWITWALPFVVALLIWSQMKAYDNDWRAAVVFAVAGVVGMIPQGLVLLTSMNFGIAAATLARRGVLVQELPAVEILARVDCLCLDKTGTLTTGGIRGKSLLLAPGYDNAGMKSEKQLVQAVSGDKPSFDDNSVDVIEAFQLLTMDRTNATADAIQGLISSRTVKGNQFKSPADAGYREIPFSSARKWSALVADPDEQAKGSKGTWVLGAPEIVLSDSNGGENLSWAKKEVASASSVGNRSICLAFSPLVSDEENMLPSQLVPLSLAILEEDIRSDAKETLAYFHDQGVQVRVISGDAPATVAAIAREIGLVATTGNELEVVDARTLPELDTPEFDEIVETADVYGRVTPDQKRGLVRAMKRLGKTVAMTGDGVNDALALKEADLGIAMGNGAPATKAVSRLVLMNGEFSVLPGVVAQGRRIIANMERVSSLFLSKTTYSLLLAIAVSLTAWAYPFLPRQLTYIGWFTIGTPAFFLALAPNNQRYHPGFLKRTLLIAVPSGLIMGLSALVSYVLVGQGTTQGQTAATLTVIITALWLLSITARPLVSWRLLLLIIMAVGAILGLLIEPVRDFFALQWPDQSQWIIIGVLGAVGCLLIEISYRLTARLRSRAGIEGAEEK